MDIVYDKDTDTFKHIGCENLPKPNWIFGEAWKKYLEDQFKDIKE